MNRILFAVADRLVRRMEFGPAIAGTAPYGPIRPFRPDIAEAIACGEYEFQRLTSKRATFRYRSVLLQVQRETRSR